MKDMVTQFIPYKFKVRMRKQELAEFEGCSIGTVNNFMKEMKQEIAAGRYPEDTISDAGAIVWINYLAWIDYTTHRKKLREKNARKYVPPYNPEQIAKNIALFTNEKEGGKNELRKEY